MNDNEKLNELTEVVEEQAYIVHRCAQNLSILADSFVSRYGDSGSSAIEAISTLLDIVYNTLLNHVWPNLCEIKHNGSECVD